jgi:polar amino acid transport system substrate-binding protein
MNRVKLAAFLAAIAMAAVACTSTEGVGNRTNPDGGPPVPNGAGVVTGLPAPEADGSCGDPTKSLRPTGPPPGPGDLPPNSAMARIKARGKLIVGVDQNTYKFGYREASTGAIVGFDIDMARQIAKAIFGTDENRLQLKVLTSAQRVPEVKTGKVDLVVQTMTINCERRKDVEFSSVYYLAGQRVLVKKDADFTGIESLGGKKVCAAKGSTSIARIVNAPSKPIGIGVDSWTDCLVMLQQNQVDAVSTDDTILAGLRDQDPFTKLVGDPFSDEPYGMAISRTSPEFVRFVNSVLEQMRADGEWTRIYNRWLAGLLDTGSTQPTAVYRD